MNNEINKEEQKKVSKMIEELKQTAVDREQQLNSMSDKIMIVERLLKDCFLSEDIVYEIRDSKDHNNWFLLDDEPCAVEEILYFDSNKKRLIYEVNVLFIDVDDVFEPCPKDFSTSISKPLIECKVHIRQSIHDNHLDSYVEFVLNIINPKRKIT